MSFSFLLLMQLRSKFAFSRLVKACERTQLNNFLEALLDKPVPQLLSLLIRAFKLTENKFQLIVTNYLLIVSLYVKEVP